MRKIDITAGDEPKCDFCSDPHIYKRYTCQSFEHPNEVLLSMGIRWGSKGDWGACRKCASLIDRGLKQALTNRSVESFMKRYKLPKEFRPAMQQMMEQLHANFYKHRLISSGDN